MTIFCNFFFKNALNWSKKTKMTIFDKNKSIFWLFINNPTSIPAEIHAIKGKKLPLKLKNENCKKSIFWLSCINKKIDFAVAWKFPPGEKFPRLSQKKKRWIEHHSLGTRSPGFQIFFNLFYKMASQRASRTI